MILSWTMFSSHACRHVQQRRGKTQRTVKNTLERKWTVVGTVFKTGAFPPLITPEAWDTNLENTPTGGMYGYPIRDWPNPKPRGPLCSSHVSIEDHHRGRVAYLFRLDLPHWARHVSYLERFKGATGDPSVLKAAMWNTHPSRNKGSRNCFLPNGRKTHRCNRQCHHRKIYPWSW